MTQRARLMARASTRAAPKAVQRVTVLHARHTPTVPVISACSDQPLTNAKE